VRVLIVEDNADHAALLTLGLREHYPSAEIVAADSLAAALAELNAHFDVVVFDLGLGDSDGPDGVARVAGLTPAPIVVWTAEARPEVHDRCIDEGAFWVVEKTEARPVDSVARAIRFAVRVAARERAAGYSDGEISMIREVRGAVDEAQASIGRAIACGV